MRALFQRIRVPFYDSCVFGKSVHKCLGKCGGIAAAAALSHRRRKSFRSHGGGGGRREAWSIKKTEITDTLYLTLNLLLTVSPMGLNVRKQNVRTFPSFKEYARGLKEKYEEGPKQCLPPIHQTNALLCRIQEPRLRHNNAFHPRPIPLPLQRLLLMTPAPSFPSPSEDDGPLFISFISRASTVLFPRPQEKTRIRLRRRRRRPCPRSGGSGARAGGASTTAAGIFKNKKITHFSVRKNAMNTCTQEGNP